MKLLLDTHVWLWLQYQPERLGSSLAVVEDPQHELLLSAASTWEIAIKWALGKLPLPAAPEDYVPRRIASSGVTPMPVEIAHTLDVAALPLHHRDLFDRLLVVQAIAEQATLVTADVALRQYDVDLVIVG